MKFPYKRILVFDSQGVTTTNIVYRPIIYVVLEHDHKVVDFEALIDSSADDNVFDVEIAELLGISWEETKHKKRISTQSKKAPRGSPDGHSRLWGYLCI